jgi:hypothetical protein
MADPLLPNVSAGLDEIVKDIVAAIEKFRAEHPEVGGLADKLESIVRDKVGSINPDLLKALLFADLMNLVTNMKGPAPHDPTELA